MDPELNPDACLAEMSAQKDWFVEKAGDLGPEGSAQPLGPDDWSLAQTIEHLVLTERIFIVALARAKTPMPEQTQAEIQSKLDLRRALLNGDRYPVPDGAVLPGPAPDLASLLADWDKQRGRLAGLREKGALPGPETLAAVHPIAGPLNGAETLRFLADHLLYHRLVTEKLIADGLPG